MAYSARNALQPAVVGFHINRLYSASNGLVTDWIHPLAEAIHFLGKGFDRLCWQPFFALDDFSNCGFDLNLPRWASTATFSDIRLPSAA